MRWVLPLVLASCSYDFGVFGESGGAGPMTTGAGPIGSGASGGAGASDTSSTGTSKPTGAGGAMNTGGAGPGSGGGGPLIPRCGAGDDNFDDNALDSARWLVNVNLGSVAEQNQQIELSTLNENGALARLELKQFVPTNCAFTFRLVDGETAVTITGPANSYGLNYHSDNFHTHLMVDFTQQSPHVVDETADGIGIVFWQGEVHLLLHVADDWGLVEKRAIPAWQPMTIGVFTFKKQNVAKVDDYGAFPLTSTELMAARQL